MGSKLGACLIFVLILWGALEATSVVYTRFRLVYVVEMTRYANELKLDAENARIVHVHRPSSTATLMGVEVTTNSAGFRDEEYPLARNGKRRAIFLGDSLTLGWGIRTEDTFEARIERQLGAQIINFGQGNLNTDQEVGIFLKEGLPYKPDLVVVFYFINDAEETAPKSQLGALLGHSRFLTLLWSRIHEFKGRVSGQLDFKRYYSGLYGESSAGWATVKRAFEELRDTCRREGIRLKVVLLPELHELAPYAFTAEHRKVSEMLKRLGVPFLDLAPKFAGIRDTRSLWVAQDDAHPNAKAHAMIADFTKDFIAEGLR